MKKGGCKEVVLTYIKSCLAKKGVMPDASLHSHYRTATKKYPCKNTVKLREFCGKEETGPK